LPTCCGLVGDTANYVDSHNYVKMSPTSPQKAVRNKVIVMEFGKRHDTTDTTDFCPLQLMDLLRTCDEFWPYCAALTILACIDYYNGMHAGLPD